MFDVDHPGQKPHDGIFVPLVITLAVDGERSDDKLLVADWRPVISIVTFFTIRLSVWGHKIGSNMQFDTL